MRETKNPPRPPKAAATEQKTGRLAAALRANLARRKAQKRDRGAGTEAAKEG